MIAGTATAVSNRVSKRQAERWGAQEAQQAPQPPPEQPAPAPPVAAAPAGGEQSTIEQLKELAALKEQGILTDDEFAAQKSKILS